jgi:hypothetical protein
MNIEPKGIGSQLRGLGSAASASQVYTAAGLNQVRFGAVVGRSGPYSIGGGDPLPAGGVFSTAGQIDLVGDGSTGQLVTDGNSVTLNGQTIWFQGGTLINDQLTGDNGVIALDGSSHLRLAGPDPTPQPVTVLPGAMGFGLGGTKCGAQRGCGRHRGTGPVCFREARRRRARGRNAEVSRGRCLAFRPGGNPSLFGTISRFDFWNSFQEKPFWERSKAADFLKSILRMM